MRKGSSFSYDTVVVFLVSLCISGVFYIQNSYALPVYEWKCLSSNINIARIAFPVIYLVEGRKQQAMGRIFQNLELILKH